jgi:hypothetical protein
MRISRAARQQGSRMQRWMLEAIKHEIDRRERFVAYVKQAQHMGAGSGSAEGADARRSLRFWLGQLSSGKKAGRVVARRTR